MNQEHGFSFVEVLVSLLLVTTVSLSLLHQQWHLSQLLHEALLRFSASNQLDNCSEEILAKQPLSTPQKPLQLNITESGHTVLLQLTWPSSIDESCCHLQRQLERFNETS